MDYLRLHNGAPHRHPARMIRVIAGRIGAAIGWAFFVAWAALNLALDWIGRSTVVDDFNQLVDRLPGVLQWLYATPWYVPAGLATALTIFLIWASWPRHHMTAAAPVMPAPKANNNMSVWPKPYEPTWVVGKHFVNQEVQLDGYAYKQCRFDNVTFSYNGTTAVQLVECSFNAMPFFTTNNPAVGGAVMLMYCMGLLPQDFALTGLHPSNVVSQVAKAKDGVGKASPTPSAQPSYSRPPQGTGQKTPP